MIKQAPWPTWHGPKYPELGEGSLSWASVGE
jgi:hypothetical protein